MAIFQPIVFGWCGQDYTVPADRALGLVAEIEEVVTLFEIATMQVKPNTSKLARAFGAALRYAGAKVSDDEVYQGLFQPGQMFEEVQKLMVVLMAIMMPPNPVSGASAGAGPKPGASFGGNAQAAPARSLKRSSKRRSVAAG
jgi:hypothetical protein